VRPSPNGEKGEESARRQLSPQRGDNVGGVAESSVTGGAPRVGAVRKATGRRFARGVLQRGGERTELRRGRGKGVGVRSGRGSGRQVAATRRQEALEGGGVLCRR
jgi:hypothetical protein